MTPPSDPLLLVVEDVEPVRQLVELQLKTRGHRVMAARDGKEALDLISSEKPAVVIADILMPRVDGFALAHKLRTNPQTANIPIIFLSATYVSAEDERFAMNLGALRFLPKPVEIDDLLVAVTEALKGKTSAKPAMSARDFYSGYRDRLENKLRQKGQQISRNQQQMATLPEEHRETYRRMIAEAQALYKEIQRELDALSKAMQDGV